MLSDIHLPNWSPPSPDKAIDAWNDQNLFPIIIWKIAVLNFQLILPQDVLLTNNFHLKVDVNAVYFCLSTGSNLS